MSAVFVQVQGENGTHIVVMSKEDAVKCKKLLRNGWNDLVNEILDRSPKLKIEGILDTSGDLDGTRLFIPRLHPGWYKVEE